MENDEANNDDNDDNENDEEDEMNENSEVQSDGVASDKEVKTDSLYLENLQRQRVDQNLKTQNAQRNWSVLWNWGLTRERSESSFSIDQ